MSDYFIAGQVTCTGNSCGYLYLLNDDDGDILKQVKVLLVVLEIVFPYAGHPLGGVQGAALIGRLCTPRHLLERYGRNVTNGASLHYSQGF